MRILIFSDSHGRVDNMIKAFQKNKNIDLVIHLGDMVRDAVAFQREIKDIPVWIVRGNNDWVSDIPFEELLEFEGKKLFITHGHQYYVKNGLSSLIARGKFMGADAVFFGHTHMPLEMNSDGIQFVNPGSIGLPAGGNRPSCALMEINNGKIKMNFSGI